MKKKKLLASLLFLIGLGIFLFPRYLLFINDIQNEKTIYEVEKQMISEEYKELLTKVKEYNQSLNASGTTIKDPFFGNSISYIEEEIGFDTDLIIGYLEIPTLSEKLPIYMGADSYHLSKGVGVVENTSLPFGGTNKNSVIAGHRGYSYSRFFRNIDELQEGDPILIHTAWETLGYFVYEKEVITPTQDEALNIVKDKDIITLLTCHPYRSNSQRLLVRGERMSDEELKTILGEATEDSLEPAAGIGNHIIKAIINPGQSFLKYRFTNSLIVMIGSILLLGNILFVIHLLFGKKKLEK